MKYLSLIFLFFSLLASAQHDYDKAEKYFQEKQYSKAKILFEAVLKENPNDFKSMEYLGDIQCHLKNWEKAIPYYETLKKYKPTQPEYFYKYGGAVAMQAKESNTFNALKMVGIAKTSFEKTIQLDPKHIGARWALIEIYIQLPGIVGGSEVKAVRYSDELLQISPVDGYLSKGHIEEYFKRYTKAEKQYQKAIVIGNSKIGNQKLADLYKNKMNQPEKAKQIMDNYNKKNNS